MRVCFLFRDFTGGLAGVTVNSDARLSNLQAIAKRSALFSNEKARQAALVTRVTKIKVKYEGSPEPCTMIMNKNISTPHDCAKHLPEPIRKRAVIAYVNGKPWDMHTPLTEECTLNFAHFKDTLEARLNMVNKVFWRSSSFLLGYTIERAFKEKHFVTLHSWPAPTIKSGSFVYDAALSIGTWNPTPTERQILGATIQRLRMEAVPFERLTVNAAVAKQIFEDNKFKYEQIDEIAASSENNTVTMYRCGDHVDLSCGPMISDSSHVGDFTVVSVHPFETPVGLLHRFQGISLPAAFTMSPFAKNVLQARAEVMNTVGLPAEAVRKPEDPQAQANDAAEDEVDYDHEDHTPKERQAAH
ncbi:39S ribosomal protein L39 [Tropilaelaps mercedesae]|uniref:39S ribosomal protein L39 n=1 Tax=Tropilaelaps mercedesae TaxID=418985 RepID=A0A1V9XJY0_9ACAR|nr:39S ribosomal protein L39 [Tropilaelaps mercedesae]